MDTSPKRFKKQKIKESRFLGKNLNGTILKKKVKVRCSYLTFLLPPSQQMIVDNLVKILTNFIDHIVKSINN